MSVSESQKLFLHKGCMMVRGMHNPEEVDQIRDVEIRDSDVFVVTYAKSGTSWLQQILLLLEFKGDMDSICKKVSFYTGSLMPWIEVNGQIQKFVKAESPRYRVTHLLQHLMPKELGPKKAKVIYVGRNPKDVLVSYYYFHKMAKMLETPKSFDEFFDKFMTGEVPGGRWFEHIKSWFPYKDALNMLFITYEEMIQDLPSVIRRIVDYLGVNLTRDQLNSVVNQTTFKNLRQNPKANYELVPGSVFDHQEGNFLRKGTVGDWKTHFTVAQNEQFDEVFKQEMKDFPVSFIWDIKEIA